MPDLNAKLVDFVEGDALTIRRTINRTASNLAAGATITKGWMTVSSDLKNPTTSQIWQKLITTTDVPGTGQIENNGAGDVDPIVRFDLAAQDTRDISSVKKYYDIQVLTSAGGPYTIERGETLAEDELTEADS